MDDSPAEKKSERNCWLVEAIIYLFSAPLRTTLSSSLE